MGKKRSRSRSGERVHKRDLLKRIYKLEKQLTKKRRESSSKRSRSRSPSYESRRFRNNSGSVRERSRSPRTLPGPSCKSYSREKSQYKSSSIEKNRSYTIHRILRDSGVSSRVEQYSQVLANAVENVNGECTGTAPTRIENISRGNTPPLIIENDVQLDDNVLEILGKGPRSWGNTKFQLHEAVCARWEHILANGLAENDRKLLLKKYGNPENFILLNVSELNPKIFSAVTALHKRRDKLFCELQLGLGKGLSTLSTTLNLVLEEQENLPKSVKEKILSSLWDSNRVMVDVFYKITANRRNLIMQGLNRQIKEILEKTTPGKFLFGPDLGEKIKSAKMLERTGK